MIWFALVLLMLLAGSVDTRKPWPLAVIAMCITALVFLHYWAVGAIP